MKKELTARHLARGQKYPAYPVFLRFAGRKALVVGGGAIAARKVTGLLDAGIEVTVLSPQITEALSQDERVHWLEGHFPEEAPLLTDFDIVVAATNHRHINEAIGKACHHRHILVNIVDDPESSDFMNGSVVRIDELGVTLSISSGGQDPALMKKLRDKLEAAAREFVCSSGEGRVNPD